MSTEAPHYSAAFGLAPLAFGVADASALPGPILITLIRAMDDLSEAAVKSLLHRMVGLGMLEVTRQGRVGVYRLAGTMLAGFAAVRDHGRIRTPLAWTGAFHSVIYDIPESHRPLRDQLRNQAFRAGYRALRPGVLISPTDESAALKQPTEPGLRCVMGWLSVELDEARAIARTAWDLDRHRASRQRAIGTLRAALANPAPEDPEALRRYHQVIQPVVDVRFNDGDLPPELLPDDWPGGELFALMDEVTRHLGPAVDRYVAGVLAASPHHNLVRRDN